MFSRTGNYVILAHACRNKSTYGMALSMVFMWTCGDIFKTSYFYLRQTPPQFFICGSLQVGEQGIAGNRVIRNSGKLREIIESSGHESKFRDRGIILD